MTNSTRCIAIVGAGFCGTVTAMNLLREVHEEPLCIVLIDRDRHARGTAYAEQASSFLLNVPAGRMSASSHDGLDFLRFAQHTVPGATAEDYLPRSLYGEYLEDRLALAERAAAANVRLQRVRARVRSIEVWRPGHIFILGFDDGHEMRATEVVLAPGNPPPAALPGTDALRGSCRLLENPWAIPHTSAPAGTVLMVGTGLTMADIVAAAAQDGRRPERVYAISRHGLVPARQTAFRSAAHSEFEEFDTEPLLRAASVSIRQVFRLVRQACREAQDRGGDWREAITFVRSIAPKLWARLPQPERARFLRHARSYWDVHRHRLAPRIHAVVEELRASHRLTVHAGRVLRLEARGEQVRVLWRPRGQRQTSVLLVDRVINCTGPDFRCSRTTDPLLTNLMANGLIQPDALGTGLQSAPDGGLINLFGRPTRGLYYVGPMLRAAYWEATAVQELRAHAERLARELARPASQRVLASNLN
ncbi:MAG TPA: FAD/NAD(P)-binding protein [Steroidobacteraceae bacterium]|nr:FAD/NAD(P)-binding protein [Steroidobacteraceae bacterium]